MFDPNTTHIIEESEELTSTMSEIVKNISLVEEKTNTDVNNFNYDYICTGDFIVENKPENINKFDAIICEIQL